MSIITLIKKKLLSKDALKISEVIFGYSLTMIFFYIFFYNIDYYVSRSSQELLHLYFNWEKKIPFLKIAFVPYIGILILPLLIPFEKYNKGEFYFLIIRLITSMIVGGFFFFFFPCKIGFPQRPISRDFEIFIQNVAGKNNLFPSLHVCLTIIIVNSFYCKVSNQVKPYLLLIVVILILSTLFSHQHHLIDVFGGVVLSFLAIKIIHPNNI